MIQEKSYEKYLKEALDSYEARCKRCGACCGLFEKDPCVKLAQSEDGCYFCSDYENRFGLQKTVNGNFFKCVTVRQIISGSWPGSWMCGYKKS